MKDIVISERHIRREALIFAACLVAMECVNVYSIIRYDGMWIEVVKSLGFVITASVVAYLIIGVIRLLFNLIVKLIKHNK